MGGKKLKLYLIRRVDNCDYDQYEAAVVAAENEEQARTMHPDSDGDCELRQDGYFYYTGKYLNGRKCPDWTNIENVKVTLIGYALDCAQAGVIYAS